MQISFGLSQPFLNNKKQPGLPMRFQGTATQADRQEDKDLYTAGADIDSKILESPRLDELLATLNSRDKISSEVYRKTRYEFFHPAGPVNAAANVVYDLLPEKSGYRGDSHFRLNFYANPTDERPIASIQLKLQSDKWKADKLIFEVPVLERNPEHSGREKVQVQLKPLVARVYLAELFGIPIFNWNALSLGTHELNKSV